MIKNYKELDEIFQRLIEIEQPDYICEGLIKSYPLQDSVMILNKKFCTDQYELLVKATNDDKIVVIFKNKMNGNNIDFNENDINYLIQSANMLGYYPTTFICKNEITKQRAVDLNAIKQIINSDLYQIIFAPKFELPMDKKDVPDIIYHISPAKFEKKILSTGLTPRTKNKFEAHPDRVYFARDINSIRYLLNKNEFIKTETEYVIFKLNTKKIKENNYSNDIHFYEDSSFKERGIYTIDNISPKYLEIFRRIQLKVINNLDFEFGEINDGLIKYCPMM